MKQRSSSFDDQCLELVTKSENILFERVIGSAQRAYLIAELVKKSNKNILIITGEGDEAVTLKNDISFFTTAALLEFPSLDLTSSKEIISSRQKTLSYIALNQSLPKIVISSLQATLQRVPSKEKGIQSRGISIHVGEIFSFEHFTEQLAALGYEKTFVTTSKGEYSVRGGVVDLFSIGSDLPLRVEFFGDEVESLRLFDASSQKSLEKVSRGDIDPAVEPISSEETLFTVMGESETLVLFTDIEKLEDRYADLIGYSALLQKAGRPIISIHEWIQCLSKASSLIFMTDRIFEELVDQESYNRRGNWKGLRTAEKITFPLFDKEWQLFSLAHPLAPLGLFYLSECLYETAPSGQRLLDAYALTHEQISHTFIVQSEVEKSWIQEKLSERDISPDDAQIVFGYLSSGFGRFDTKESFVPMGALTGIQTTKKSQREKTRGDQKDESLITSSQGQLVTGFDAYSLELQDSVVHFHHGIGTFLGVEKRPNSQGIEQEFFLIEYAERSKLYVPLHQAHLLTKYIGSGELAPRLHTLGASRWKKLREETEKAIVGYASELLKAHAQRASVGGIEYPEDSPKMALFEAEFPYQETIDQLQAIQDVKQDMCSKKAMDRLICGDVGYGKTEVAIRASFKAVTDGKKQVAVLVPTTVLALQHYDNFLQRMEPFGIRIGILSRFQGAKQNRHTIEKIGLGELDVIIGTHKLIQKGVPFQDLGLVIVDEEQRFGVKAKEYLKALKSGVDCLTLSATPIPRTLYMSLAGAKDLSTIATPPHNRLPIQSIVMEFNAEVIQTAIAREINRGGQLFYIHNRVETITDAAARVQKLAPRARIMAVHGQMEGDQIDAIFHAFKKGEIDILVATTIVENGIDIPNANTIIIERADQFGVAELYQLRGRVGRSNKRAFAYFLISAQRALSEIARKRIHAISHAGGYGGGLKVAMRDLEIRGAGDILGTEQSGHVATIGFHLYCKLLKRTVESFQGKKPLLVYDTKIDVPYHAKLPEQYIQDISLRIEIYQRLGDVENELQIVELEKEIRDRFGRIPKEAEWLMAVSKIRVLAAIKGMTLVKIEGLNLTLERKEGKELKLYQKRVPKYQTPHEFYEGIRAILMQQE
ncbi:MAG: transcription-repair coupling factor [Chlamydia sp.]